MFSKRVRSPKDLDIFSTDKGDDDICKIKLITDFFKNINVGNMGPGIVKRLYEENSCFHFYCVDDLRMWKQTW